jgi:hypothetical protein
MASSKRIEDRESAAEALGSSFNILPDKDQGWQDLHRLAQDEDSDVRERAAYSMVTAFSQVPNRVKAWEDLIKLTHDEDRNVNRKAREALGKASSVTWKCLCRLTQEGYSHHGWIVSSALINAFHHTPDKIQACQDLHRLAHDEDIFVRGSVAYALVYVFSQVPDMCKMQAWQDLHDFAIDENRIVRGRAAEALGKAFSQVSNKRQAWEDLVRLTNDNDDYVKMCAYYSLGRASVFKATESDDKDKMKTELTAAITYFEKSSPDSPFSPARFCCPFYRSYFAMAFQEAKEDEVQRYLEEAKKAVGGSKIKDELYKAIKNLAEALQEAQRLKEKSILEIASHLNAYRCYCENAADLMKEAEEGAPGAVKLMKKCNPIIEERIVEIIAGIQKTAREIRQVTRGSGTKYEAPGARINQEAKSLSSKDPINTYNSSTRIASILREFCSLLPRNKRGHACDIVDEIEAEQELPDRLSKIELALTYLQPNISLEAYELATAQKLDLIDKKLDTVIHDLAKIKIGSGNIFANLCAVRSGLAAIAENGKKAENPESASEHQSTPDANQIKMGDLIEAKVLELEEILKTKATKEDNQAILNKLESLKPSVGWEWLGRMADLIAVFDESIRVLQFLA